MTIPPQLFEETDLALIPSMINKLKLGYKSHTTQSIAFRIKQLEIVHKIVTEPQSRELLTKAMYLDLGRSRFESVMYELDLVAQEVVHFIHLLSASSESDITRVGTNLLNLPGSSLIRNDPYGTVLIAAPWNYPTMLLLQPLATALAAGNTVLLRPGSFSQHTSHTLQTLIQANFDPQYVNICIGERQVTTAILEHQFDFICFTGGPTLGQVYHKAANKFLTPCMLELGGSNPTLVWNDVNLDVTAKRLTWGCFMNSAQTCIRPQIIFCHKDVVEPLVTKLKEQIHTLYQYGDDHTEYRVEERYEEYKKTTQDPVTIQQYMRMNDEAARVNARNVGTPEYSIDYIKHSPYYGRMITHDATDRLINLIEADREFIVFGGEYSREEKFVSPTVMVFKDQRDFDNAKSVANGEIFGPIVTILAVENVTDCINWINAHDKPLAMYAFTNSDEIQQLLIKNTSSGSLVFNDCMVHLTNHDLPFGGVGKSGMGAYHGKWGLEAFSHQKAVMIKGTFGDAPIRYPPYTQGAQSAFGAIAALQNFQHYGLLSIPIIALTAYGLYNLLPAAVPLVTSGLGWMKQYYDDNCADTVNSLTSSVVSRSDEL